MATYTVSATDTRLKLGVTERVESVIQNVAIILRTRAGTCPMYRQFGLPRNYEGKPTAVARPILYAEIREAVEEFEPRCEVVNIRFEEDADEPGIIHPIVEVQIFDE